MKVNKTHLTLVMFAPWGLLGLALSSPLLACNVMIDRNASDNWESVPNFVLVCAFLGLFSPLYSIPYTACKICNIK
jgi:hypothetical protein